MKSAVVMSEDAAWTTPLDAEYLKCLPQIGIKVVDHIRFSPDTTDFTPIFNKIEGEKPDVIITGISHVGMQPTVQWKQQEVPIPMFGISSQATNSSFWNDTNGATEGVLFQAFSGSGRRGHAEDAAVRRRLSTSASATTRPIAATPPMTRSITSPTRSSAPARSIPTSSSTQWKRPIVSAPSAASSSRARTRPIRTRSRSAPTPSPGLMLQWQNGKQVNLWPAKVANGKLKFPNFIKVGSAN